MIVAVYNSIYCTIIITVISITIQKDGLPLVSKIIMANFKSVIENRPNHLYKVYLR